jgi:hypothetical protein
MLRIQEQHVQFLHGKVPHARPQERHDVLRAPHCRSIIRPLHRSTPPELERGMNARGTHSSDARLPPQVRQRTPRQRRQRSIHARDEALAQIERGHTSSAAPEENSHELRRAQLLRTDTLEPLARTIARRQVAHRQCAVRPVVEHARRDP